MAEDLLAEDLLSSLLSSLSVAVDLIGVAARRRQHGRLRMREGEVHRGFRMLDRLNVGDGTATERPSYPMVVRVVINYETWLGKKRDTRSEVRSGIEESIK